MPQNSPVEFKQDDRDDHSVRSPFLCLQARRHRPVTHINLLLTLHRQQEELYHGKLFATAFRIVVCKMIYM